MRKLFAASVLLFIALTGHAQSAKDFLKKGQQFYAAKDYTNALKAFTDGLKVHPQDAKLNYQAGVTYLSLPNKAESLRYLQTAFTINPSVDENLYYYLGLSYQSNRQYQKAEEFFNEYKRRNKKQSALVDKKIKQNQFADSVTHAPSTAVVENVGKAINSSFHEYSPLVSTDGNTMIFTSNRPDEGAAVKGVPLFEDIYISKRVNGEWTKPEKISANINIKFNDAAASLSGDGKTLVLYYEYGGGDIYISQLNGNEWSKPIPLNENVNTPNFWETSAFLTADGKKLYFSSNRPDGVGNLDIYVSEMEETGDWGKAENLGPVINTTGREDSPALDAEGKTLFFSSDGHPGMGGIDIFKSEFKDGKWQKPVNLGYPINSVEDDSFFAITEDKKRAFFSTLREEGNAEIYTLTFIEPEQQIASPTPPPATSPSTETTPAETTRSITTTAAVPTVTAATTTPANRPVAVAPKKSTSTPPVATKTTPRKSTPPSTAPAELVVSGTRKFLFFSTGKDDLNTQSQVKLEGVLASLTDQPTMHVLIEGHTDNTGSELLNNALAIKRANAVAKYLTRRGIAPNRLSLKGYGAKRPIVSNDDEVGGRELNRRIEIGFVN